MKVILNIMKATCYFLVISYFQELNFSKMPFQELLRCMFTFDEKHIAAAVLHLLYRRLTFATTYTKSIGHVYIREQLDEILGLSKQQQITSSEPSKKKHKTMEDQFADPHDDRNTYDTNSTATSKRSSPSCIVLVGSSEICSLSRLHQPE